MFSGLASLLFGNANSDTSDSTKTNSTELSTDNNQSSISDSINLRLLSTETEEDDWLLVDKEEEESLPRTDSEEELPFIEIRKSPTFHRPGTPHLLSVNCGQHHLLQDAMSRSLYLSSSPPPILPSSSSMEESWFLTPPPCFTSTGPVNMESSPFENLLIEHPSMSVYHSIRSAQQEAAESFVNVDLRMEESQPHPIANRSAVIRTVRVVPRTIPRSEIFGHQQVREPILLRNSQKVHDKKERQNLCRGALKRTNKVRDFNSKGNRQRRSDMQHCKILSGANNNRKC